MHTHIQLAKIHSLETIDSAIPVDGDKTLFDVIRPNDYAIRSVRRLTFELIACTAGVDS